MNPKEKQALKLQIAKGETKKAIELLLSKSEIINDPELLNPLVPLANTFYALQAEDEKGLLDHKEKTLRSNRIIDKLVLYIDKIPEGAAREVAPSPIPQSKTVEIKIDKPFESLTYELKESLARQLRDFLNLEENQLIIILIKNGSLIYRIKLPAGAARLLIKRFRFQQMKYGSYFRDKKIVSIKPVGFSIIDPIYTLAARLEQTFLGKYYKWIIGSIILLGLVYIFLGPQQDQRVNLSTLRLEFLETVDEVQKESNDIRIHLEEAIAINKSMGEELSIVQQKMTSGLTLSKSDFTGVRNRLNAINDKQEHIEKEIADLDLTVKEFLEKTNSIIGEVPRNEMTQELISDISQKEARIKRSMEGMNSSSKLLGTGIRGMYNLLETIEDISAIYQAPSQQQEQEKKLTEPIAGLKDASNQYGKNLEQTARYEFN
jgi:hypothetical protein